ncbi:MAG TPA: hypothetical protein VMP68_21315 [Candidatus Eisenbacteria bacterium]|nr:hypothetical protein [Candidatus Eisenbacteria bacterium]
MATITLPGAALRRDRAYDNYFFSAMALLILATVFAGFARTYFLAGVFRAPLPNVLIHIHGAAFSAWILLLITQTALVTAHRVDIHRKLGLTGFALACTMIVLGLLAATNSLSRDFAPPGSPFTAQQFYVVPIAAMLMFTVLIACAYVYRTNPASHKRLILLATFALMDAPTGRPPFAVITHHQFLDCIFVYAFLLLLVAYDLWSIRKVHHATIWGGIFIFVVTMIRVPIGMTHPWLAFAGWVQHLTR